MMNRRNSLPSEPDSALPLGDKLNERELPTARKRNGQALIFDIERFSTTDGPGIRTVIFFKGCNLDCYWCHNPEGKKYQSELRFDESKCIGCLACSQVCPTGAHTFTDGRHQIDPVRCNHCCACVDVCYPGALQRVGYWMDVESVYAEIAADRPFYERSGGGVTLSGGEPLLQGNFVKRLLQLCQQEGIHTAVETNLCFTWDKIVKLLPYIDLVMTDIKHMDENSHRRGTGGSIRRILYNLKRLADSGKPVIVRTPIIPGYNDSNENITLTARFLKSISNLQYYELLSFNPLGSAKGYIVGGQSPRDISGYSRARIHDLAALAYDEGIRVVVDGSNFSDKNGKI